VLQQLAGDALAGACHPLPASAVGMELDFGAGLAVVTGALAAASTSGQALDAVRLLMLSNSVALRALEPAERAAGAGAQHSRPATAFSPVAVTLDELGTAWDQGRLRLTVQSALNGRKLGLCDAAAGMAWSFGELMAHAARTRALGAGSIVCSGPLRAAPGGKAAPNASSACASLLDRRHWEAQRGGQSSTGFLQLGDQIRIDLKGPDGRSLCGAIEQTVGERPPSQQE
jgi:fumarylacetoacetate (FAA) hydrolase